MTVASAKTRLRSALSSIAIAGLLGVASVVAVPTAASAATCVEASRVAVSSSTTLARTAPCLTGAAGQRMSASKMNTLFISAANSMAASQRTSLSVSTRNAHNLAARQNVYRMAALLILPYFKTAKLTSTEATRINTLHNQIVGNTMSPQEFLQLTNIIRNLHAHQLLKSNAVSQVNVYFSVVDKVPTSRALSGANIDAIKASTKFASGLMNTEIYKKGTALLISASLSRL